MFMREQQCNDMPQHMVIPHLMQLYTQYSSNQLRLREHYTYSSIYLKRRAFTYHLELFQRDHVLLHDSCLLLGTR